MAVPKPTLEPLISPKPKTPAIFWRRCAKLLVTVWTGILITFLVVSLNQEHQSALETACTGTWSQSYWTRPRPKGNACPNGISVATSEAASPHSYFGKVSALDLLTPWGRGLTRVNFACLDRHSQETAPPRTATNQRLGTIWLHQGILWLLGLAGIGLGAARLDKNIIRRSEVEMGLEEANRTLEGLMEAAPWAIVGLDPQGCVSRWSPAATRMFGWQASQVVGQPPPFLSEEMQPEFRELYARGLQGEQVRGVAVCHHRNGMAVDISFSMSPLYGPEDQLKGVVAVLEDITERQNTEKELFKVNEELKSWVFEFSRRNRDITLLNQMGDLLQVGKTVEEGYACAGRFLPRIFSRESGVLFRYHREQNILAAVYRWGGQAPGAEQFSPDECQALTARQDHVIQHPGDRLLCGHLTGVSHSYMCIPMIAHDETLGLILLHKDLPEGATGEILSESKRRLAITAAKQIALSLANIKLRNSLKEQAIRDPLTSLFNRRYLEEMLEREILRVQRQGAPLSIIMLDLDLFKDINTTFGHDGGDAMIQAVGDFLRSNFRREDIACRYGGEEFIVILPGASLETSVARAEKMRQGVQELQVEYRGRSLGPVTASLGVAAFPDHGADGEALIRAADAALYQAKEGGRNRVVVAE